MPLMDPPKIGGEIIVRRWLWAGIGDMCVGYEGLQTQAPKHICILNIQRKTHLQIP